MKNRCLSRILPEIFELKIANIDRNMSSSEEMAFLKPFLTILYMFVQYVFLMGCTWFICGNNYTICTAPLHNLITH
jgi:hypothetical protein